MNIKEKLESILEYYSTNRCIGHSMLAIESAKRAEKDVLFLVQGYSAVNTFKSYFKPSDNVEVTSKINRGINGKLLVFDNSYIYNLVYSAYSTIYDLENEIDKLKGKNFKLRNLNESNKEIINLLKRENSKMDSKKLNIVEKYGKGKHSWNFLYSVGKGNSKVDAFKVYADTLSEAIKVFSDNASSYYITISDICDIIMDDE